jgi:hypothetical protein
MDTQDHSFDGAILRGFVELGAHAPHWALVLSQSKRPGLRHLTQDSFDLDQGDLRPAFPLNDGLPQFAGLAAGEIDCDAS